MLAQPDGAHGDGVKPHDRFTRYVERLTDAEVIELHRIVSRRAQRVYAVIYRGNYEAGMQAGRAKYERAMTQRLAA